MFALPTFARTVQIFCRLIMAALVGKAGLDSAQAISFAQPASELGAAGFFWVIDQIIHSTQFSQLMTYIARLEMLLEGTEGRQDAASDSAGGTVITVAPAASSSDVAASAAASAPSVPPTSLALLLGVLLTLALAGCAQNETNRAAQGMIDVQVAASNLDDLVRGNAISLADARQWQTVIHDGQRYVNAYYDALRAGDSDALATAKAGLAAVDVQLLTFLARYPIQPTPIVLPPTTTP